MSGILGLWNLDGCLLEPELLSRLSGSLAHYGLDGEGHWLGGAVGLACQLMRVTPEAAAETQPLVHASGSVLVFNGRLDNREELLRRIRGSAGVTASSPDSTLVLGAYEAFGERFPEYLNGDFALGLFDPRRQQLILARDVIGLRPLYYHRAGETFIFASEIKAILAHPRVRVRPNDDVIAEVFLGGPEPENPGETCFAGLFSLPPAHLAILSPRRLVIRRYWDFDTTRKIRLSSFSEYAEAFRHLFAEAVRRRLRSAHPVAVAVSGGLDSSSIFCQAETIRRAAPQSHPALLGLAYLAQPGSRADEECFVAEIERAYDASIERVPLGPTRFMDGVGRAVWHLETPKLDLQWKDGSRLYQVARGRGARVLLTGHWGDQMLFGWAYLIDLFRRLAWRKAWNHLNEFSRWHTDVYPGVIKKVILRGLLAHKVPTIIKPLLRRLRSRISPAIWDVSWYTEAFRRRSWRSPVNLPRLRGSEHSKSIYRYVRSRHNVSLMELLQKLAAMQGLEMAMPFLDRDLVSFLMAIPGEVRNWQGIPRCLLRRAMDGVLPAAIAQRRWKADFGHQMNEGMQQEYPKVAHYLHDAVLIGKFGYIEENLLMREMERRKNLILAPNRLR